SPNGSRPSTESLTACARAIAEANLGSRLCFKNRNMLDQSIYDGATADAVMLNHCLHHFTRTQAGSVVRSASKLLAPGGTLIVTESYLSPSGIEPAGAALFSFYLMVNNATGELHDVRFLESTLHDNGLAVSSRRIGYQNEEVLLLGHRNQ
ncbi:MAG: class I SAM-dependent methyltransferase, partial [Rhodospirillales bacterium]|nr:class I SAM-dependent methyltransferase [Rhodospirillales bacterium]